MASTMFQKARKGIKATAYDAEGNEVEVEVREDAEQSVKLDETVELLLAAGYFRARIKGLSPFDKVVGGMTWCITSANEDVDVDLLFQENSTIGQKIALTEKIVAALPRLKCPHRLEPYQIQGLDFIHIYPVVQWLVKKAIETREEMTHQIRASAMFEFGKHAESPEQAGKQQQKTEAVATVRQIKEAYKPRRQFKAPENSGGDEETRVQSTLLEYGRRYGMSRAPKKDDKKKAAVAKSLGDDGGEEEDLVAMEEKRIKSLMRGMSQAGEGSISSSALGSIVGMDSERIAQLSEEYASQQAEMHAAEGERVGGAAAHKRAITSLQKQIDQAEQKLAAVRAEHEAAQAAHAEAQAAANRANKISRKIDKEMAKMDELEGDEANKEILAKLRGLITLNESLKMQEQQFRASCKEEMESLEAKIAALKGEGVEVVDLDDERRKAIQKQLEADQAKMRKIRLLAAKRNREIAALERKIDDIPSRSELTQYQRRFVELYNQVAAKLRETRQFYTLFNTLDDTKLYMAKEQSLLTSIHDTFEKAMTNASTKEQFLQQFAQIIGGIRSNLTKVSDRRDREKMRRDELRDSHIALVEQERNYYKAVRDYEAECSKNEVLQSKLKRRRGGD